MNKAVLFILISLFFSCRQNSPTQVKVQEAKSCETLIQENLHINPKTDSILLGFVLGQSEKDIEKQIKKLESQNKIQPNVTWNLGSILGKINGWGYDLFLNDNATKYETLIGYSTYNGKLASLTLFGNDRELNIQTLVDFLNSKFGEFKCKKPDGNMTMYYWFDGYKQIVLTNNLLPFVIEYTDLRVDAEKAIDKQKADSLKTEENRRKADSSKDDFK